MATHGTSTLDAILLGINAQLMASLKFPQERVLLCDPESLDFHPHGDQYLLFWADPEPASTPDSIGSGRINTQFINRLEVRVRTRFQVDEASQAMKWLTDQRLGHVRVRTAVYNALCEFQVQDANGNILNFPIQPVAGGRPGRGWRSTAKSGQRREAGRFVSGQAVPADKSWGESVLLFDVRYAATLDTSQFV